jgi:outer membrane protein OmpA-like peptidoglycan-associated protein
MQKIATICLLSLGLTACAGQPTFGSKTTATATGAGMGAAAGAALGATIGAIAGNAGKGAWIGAVAGAALGSSVGYYMSAQEEALRAGLQGTDVSVQRQNNNVNLVMPSKTAFASGSPTIAPQFTPALDTVADVLKKSPETLITISGHSDSTGNAVINQQLSKKRAEVIARYLANKGINPKRIQTVGYGDSYPIASNDTEEGRAANRRIEVKVHPKQQ